MDERSNFAPDYLDSVEELYGDTQAGAVIKYLRAALEASHAPVPREKLLREALEKVLACSAIEHACSQCTEEARAILRQAGTTPEAVKP